MKKVNNRILALPICYFLYLIIFLLIKTIIQRTASDRRAVILHISADSFYITKKDLFDFKRQLNWNK